MAVLYPYDYNDIHQLSTRSLSSTLTPNATQRTTLIVAGCYIIIIGILWYALSLSLFFLCITELPMNEHSQACAILELYQCDIHYLSFSPLVAYDGMVSLRLPSASLSIQVGTPVWNWDRFLFALTGCSRSGFTRCVFTSRRKIFI